MSLDLYAEICKSSAKEKIDTLKRRFVLDLLAQEGPFWDAVRGIRSEWGITARRIVPSEEDPGSTYPVKQAPENRVAMEFGLFIDRWREALRRSLRDGFVPDELKRWVSWDDFFGACVMCDPPDDRLLEFARFGRFYPLVFWPTVDSKPAKIHSMVAPPVEMVFKDSGEGGKPNSEYRIVVDAGTTEDDVINARRAIRAAYGYSDPGGRPPVDELVAVYCAILLDDHNGVDPTDRRFKDWTLEKLADRFKAYGVKNARSAQYHVEKGREWLRTRGKRN